LEGALEASAAREHALQETLDQLQGEFDGIRFTGERRRAIRKRIPQALVELLNGHGKAGSVIAGTLRDLSSAGIGLETDCALPEMQAVHLRVILPGLGDPLESRARLVWQQAEGQPPRYHIGCRLVHLSKGTRTLIEQLIGREAG